MYITCNYYDNEILTVIVSVMVFIITTASSCFFSTLIIFEAYLIYESKRIYVELMLSR